ncbi:anti-sigma regulatory factor [Leptospira yasudae]|uniref:ATP-binding protein n=1 Tax=Leptospira yasudae TaxID=2202201 RepID=A0A5F2AV47_9LEPT|nr:ATP-binding protein [Leptospira yasudae]MBW0432521.1 ATP-binding protein [Leptospira yasudae]RHX81605.1 anti-sigma regulatory factor [Leptospira yasudae]RHX95860.1 anti-sigma regulatory factor [Leptospira yasudae]TGK29666.1 ATP-binding protein [Leptospira yasudae]TGL82816.1 ATP-binding protein [Leptospira yasudae]
MSFHLSREEIEKQIQSMLSQGLTGSVNDFFAWIRMETLRKFKDEPDIENSVVSEILEGFVNSGTVKRSKFNAKEFHIHPDQIQGKKFPSKDSYVLLGKIAYQPMQYVRSRLEFFLKSQGTPEDIVIDLCIGALEAVENAVKYGDGTEVEVEYSIDRDKTLFIKIVNNLKELNLEQDIERGKFSSTATLMRGMMVMQKLFDELDLEILEDRKQAQFNAKKKLS